MLKPRRGVRPGGILAAGGFTLIELMVVAAIIAVLLTVMAPAIMGIMQTSQLAQADNILRAALFSARTYAVHQQVVAGIRCQDDGHIVQIYARNMDEPYRTGDYNDQPVYDMKAVEGMEPAKLPGPWRVTAGDVGVYSMGYELGTYNYSHQRPLWIGPTGGPSAGYYAAPEWLDAEHAWFVFPVVLFNPEGRVLLGECKFHYSNDRDEGWYPTMAGSFGKVCDNYTNRNRWFRVPGTRYDYKAGEEPLKYTNQVVIVGWRCTSVSNYKGTGSHHIPVESPSVTAAPHLFNYLEFRGQFTYHGSSGPFDYRDIYRYHREAMDQLYAAAETAVTTGSTCRLDVNTGMPVRARAYQRAQDN